MYVCSVGSCTRQCKTASDVCVIMYMRTSVDRSKILLSKVHCWNRRSPFLILGGKVEDVGSGNEGISREVMNVSVKASILGTM